MLLILEFALQFVGEVLIQLVLEVLFELGFQGLASKFKKRTRHRISIIFSCFLWGIIAGGISLFIAPMSHITNPDLRLLNLIVTPTAIGFFMMQVGKLRAKKGQELVNLDRFGYAFIFAFSMSLVRYVGAQ